MSAESSRQSSGQELTFDEAMLKDLERKIGIRFSNRNLLRQALTNAKLLANDERVYSNERLEWFGDHVLRFALAQLLYVRLPNATEHSLTRFISIVLSNQHLAVVARGIGLSPRKTVRSISSKHPLEDTEKRLADAFEALIGAVYLDKGMGGVEAVIEKLIVQKLEEMKVRGVDTYNSPSRLLAYVQKKFSVQPTYGIQKNVLENGQPKFTATVHVKGIFVGRGFGSTPKIAAKAAAACAFAHLQYHGLSELKIVD